MNKTEMARKLATTCGLSIKVASEAIDALFAANGGIIADELWAGRVVMLTGFGTFRPVRRPERAGVNPATGQAIKIASKVVPRFKPGKSLAERIGRIGAK